MTFSGPIAAFSEKWYFPNYFRNSALLLNISKINANGSFWPCYVYNQIGQDKMTLLFILYTNFTEQIHVEAIKHS